MRSQRRRQSAAYQVCVARQAAESSDVAVETDADPSSVFLNVPFDRGYEPLFITLVGTLICLGQKPRCVLEVTETGDGRLRRIFDLIRKCSMSVHDLSRIGPPVRFNMPFELGLACSLRLLPGSSHEVVVLEAKNWRLDRTLSDYKGRDPLIHYNRCDDLVTCLLDVVTSRSLPDAKDLRESAETLRQTAAAIKRRLRIQSVFRASAFRAISEAATEIAVTAGYIAPHP
jgi:hypothetical protein